MPMCKPCARYEVLGMCPVYTPTLIEPIPSSVTNIHIHSIRRPTLGDGGALFEFEIAPDYFETLLGSRRFEQRELTDEIRGNSRLFSNADLALVNAEYYVATNSMNHIQIKANSSHTKVVVSFSGFFGLERADPKD